jgi:hypothetical protein
MSNFSFEKTIDVIFRLIEIIEISINYAFNFCIFEIKTSFKIKEIEDKLLERMNMVIYENHCMFLVYTSQTQQFMKKSDSIL